MSDEFKSFGTQLDSPARKAASVTPHDSNELSSYSRALYVGTGGDLVVRLAGDSANVTFANVPSGTLLPIRAKLVHTSSTADDILALS